MMALRLWLWELDHLLAAGQLFPCDRIFRPRWFVGNEDKKKPMILCACRTSRSREQSTKRRSRSENMCKVCSFYSQNNKIEWLSNISDTFSETCTRSRCVKVCGLYFLLVLFGCWLARQPNSDHVAWMEHGLLISLKRFALSIENKMAAGAFWVRYELWVARPFHTMIALFSLFIYFYFYFFSVCPSSPVGPQNLYRSEFRYVGEVYCKNYHFLFAGMDYFMKKNFYQRNILKYFRSRWSLSDEGDGISAVVSHVTVQDVE